MTRRTSPGGRALTDLMAACPNLVFVVVGDKVAAETKPPERRVDWLCGCGQGRLGVLESEVPDFCPLCGHPIGEGAS